MKKIYAVNAGSCDNYRVDAVFSTPELAKEYMEAVPDADYNDIEEYELDKETAEIIKHGYSMWHIYMLVDGTTERVAKVDTRDYNIICVGHNLWRRSLSPDFDGIGFPDCLVSTVWAKTEKQAVELVNEHRVMLIASGEWN